MPAPASAVSSLPASALAALRSLGADLRIARQRRGESLRAWAFRMDVSVPTLIRMEKGDPAVGIGVYATALFLMGRHGALGVVAAPEADTVALAADIQRAKSAHAPRNRGLNKAMPDPRPRQAAPSAP